MQHPEPISGKTVDVIVDYGERASRVPAVLEKTPGTRVGFDRLPLGDYLINDRVVIERKTIVDFAQSIQNGRLFQQCAQLAGVVSRKPCLLLEGTMADLVSVRLRMSTPRSLWF